MDRRRIIFLMVGILLILLIVVELVGYFILRKKDVGILPDQQSTQRIQTINQVLMSYFGNNWPEVLLAFGLLILLILGLFLVITKKDVEVNDTDKTYKWLNITGIGFLVILTVAVLFAIYRMYTETQKVKTRTDPNSQIIDDQKKQLIQLFVIIVALIFLILIILGGGLWGYKKLKTKMFNKTS
jgi:hypothetical protein